MQSKTPSFGGSKTMTITNEDNLIHQILEASIHHEGKAFSIAIPSGTNAINLLRELGLKIAVFGRGDGQVYVTVNP